MPFRPRFCAACGAPVVDEGGRFRCERCGRRSYLNSKAAAGGLVVRDGRVLLVRRKFEPFKDWWDIPGGFLETGEHPNDAVVREVREETGLEVRPTELVGIYMDKYGDGPDADDTMNLYYVAEIVGGAEQPGDDAVELGWFRPDALPENVAFETGRAVLADWRAGRRR